MKQANLQHFLELEEGQTLMPLAGRTDQTYSEYFGLNVLVLVESSQNNVFHICVICTYPLKTHITNT